ncbi:hypothetical protein [Candidatus Entotheonella palauensis]|uniref:hypothetical protein n=1 Tax=Candidatus Entotheonella palauensis TaxID=93172 RepID=UPI000B7E0DAA|nr:hypothetical protein [Candidatus Entotheonella palauensis]
MRKRHVFQSTYTLITPLWQPVLNRIPAILLAGLLILINSHWSTAQQSLWTESSRAAPASPTLVQFNQALQQLAASVLPAIVSLTQVASY